MDETTATKTLSPPPPALPFDVIPEILCRLPVKLLIQLKCVCKSWKSLISDPKFAKKHLRVSNTYHHLLVFGRDSLLRDSTISSLFSDTSTTSFVTQPETISFSCVSSCDGILLFPINNRSALLLWNPSIRTFKILPPLSDIGPLDFEDVEDSQDYYDFHGFDFEYAFGYDHFIDNYKVIVTSHTRPNVINVHVYTLGADSWRSIDDFPNRGPIDRPGVFVSGSVNWLALDAQLNLSDVIVSLDLDKESYRRLPMPDLNLEKNRTTFLGVLRDCLCIFANYCKFIDVWVMKEYGIEESWTKLFSVPYMGAPCSFYLKVVYVSEDNQVLLMFDDYKERPLFDSKLVIYNSTNGTFKIPKIQDMHGSIDPEVYVESLISPCS